MNLTKLKWTKNINHQGNDKYWAYQNIKREESFLLHWRQEQEKNAFKPKEGELIILRQRTKITHIVKLLSNLMCVDNNTTEFNLSRYVQAVWVADPWNTPPDQDTVFGYHVNLQGGRVMELENLLKFRENWNQQDGLLEFQKHVQKVLKQECE